MRRGTTKQSRPALPPDTQLLSRTDFDALVKHRSHGRCVLCGVPAVDAHHVLDRKLYPDGATSGTEQLCAARAIGMWKPLVYR